MLIFEQKIFEELGYKVQVAGEIEFFISPGFADKSTDNQLLAEMLLELAKRHIALRSIGFEVAPNQFEIALTPKSPEQAINEIEEFKKLAVSICKKYKQNALFDAKPFNNLPGSGLHIHLSLTDNNENAIFVRKENKEESELMLNAVGGLCQTMLKNFVHFAPNENSYKRYSSQPNLLGELDNELATHNNAPVNVSWGGNNRTTAIRIPTSTLHEESRHIEFRVAGADANPEIVIEKILEGVYFGIKNKVIPPQKIYGNAYDNQYNFLTRFPLSLEEAKKLAV